MTTELVKSIDAIRNKIILLETEIQTRIEENLIITKKNEDIMDELANLNKVSMVRVLSRQIDEKNNKIQILEKQIASLKKRQNLKLIDMESDNESISEQDTQNVEEGYELIVHDDKKLLKNLETRKLYYIGMNGTKGKYAGKESKKGKIKLKD